MTTSPARLVARLVLGAALVVVSTTAVSLVSEPPQAAVSPAAKPSALRASAPESARAPTSASRPYSYRWPVKPFGVQHPVRGFFGDPRIAKQGRARQFHFGIDISASNGTAVYATLSGIASIHPLHSTTVEIAGSDDVVYGYWHIVPTVRSGQRVVAYETVIGHVEAPYGHVHFSEERSGRYLNPLRPGALGPFVDDTTPGVRSVVFEDGLLVAETYDSTPVAVPRPWHDLPVMPALIRWRTLDAHGHALTPWRTAADFRLTIPPASEFDDRWAPGTMQNHVRAPGRYRVVLGSEVDPRAGRTVEVAVSDTHGNGSRTRFPLGAKRSLQMVAATRAVTPVPILMYHVVDDAPTSAPYPQLYVTRSEFAAQVRWLAGHGYEAVTQRDVWDHWHRGRPLPRKPIVISFDDGYRSVAHAAFPELRRHSWPAVLNLTVKNLHVRGGLSERQVQRLLGAGWELASHTLTHPDLPSLDTVALRHEVSRSRAVLQGLFGAPVDFFCYPAGRYDKRVIAAVQRAGYLGATTTLEGLARPGEPYELRRVRVSGGDGVRGLAQALND